MVADLKCLDEACFHACVSSRVNRALSATSLGFQPKSMQTQIRLLLLTLWVWGCRCLLLQWCLSWHDMVSMGMYQISSVSQLVPMGQMYLHSPPTAVYAGQARCAQSHAGPHPFL